MKKIALILAVLIFAYSCKKDKSTQKSVQNQLIGKWTLKKDSSVYDLPQNNEITYIKRDGFNSLKFNTDGTGSGDDNSTFSYQVSNNEVSFNVAAFVDSAGGTVSAAKYQNVPIVKLDPHNLTLIFQIHFFAKEYGSGTGKRYEYFTK